MVKNILNKYFVKKYGNVYAPKPPLGYRRDIQVSIFKKVVYYIKKSIWKIDCFIDNYSGQSRKTAWLKRP